MFKIIALLLLFSSPALLLAEEGTPQEGEAECQSDQNAKVTTQADGSKKTECVPKWEKMDGKKTDGSPADDGTTPPAAAESAAQKAAAAASSAPAASTPAASSSGGGAAAATSNPAAPSSEPTRIGGDTPAAASPAPPPVANQPPQGLGNKDPIREEQRALAAAAPAPAPAPSSDKDNQADLLPQAQAAYGDGLKAGFEGKPDQERLLNDPSYAAGVANASAPAPADQQAPEVTPVAEAKASGSCFPTCLLPAQQKIADEKKAAAEKAAQTAAAQATLSKEGSRTPTGLPIINDGKGRISSGFGARNTGISGASRNHLAIDIAAPIGTPIKPTADGVVSKESGYSTSYGNRTVIDHGNGVQTTYSHKLGAPLKEGTVVTRDTTIGVVGMTGITSGPHLHFEVIIDGNKVNPTDPRTQQILAQRTASLPAYAQSSVPSGGVVNSTGSGAGVAYSPAAYSPPSYLGGGGGYTGGGGSAGSGAGASGGSNPFAGLASLFGGGGKSGGGGSSSGGSGGGGAGQAVAAAPFTSPLAGTPVPFTPLAVTPTVPVAVAGTSGLDNLNLNCDNPTRGIEILLCPPKAAASKVTSCTNTGGTDAAKDSGLMSKSCV